MATKQRKTSSSSRSGGTLFTLLFGLILGLAIAAAVAYFVTQVPMPFADKASRSAPNVLLPDVRDAPDPNRALMGDGGAGGIANRDAITPPQALPGSEENPSLTDDIGALLATLGAPTQSGNNGSETQTPREAASPAQPVAPIKRHPPKVHHQPPAQHRPVPKPPIICRQARSAPKPTPKPCVHALFLWGNPPKYKAPKLMAQRFIGSGSGRSKELTK